MRKNRTILILMSNWLRSFPNSPYIHTHTNTHIHYQTVEAKALDNLIKNREIREEKLGIFRFSYSLSNFFFLRDFAW